MLSLSKLHVSVTNLIVTETLNSISALRSRKQIKTFYPKGQIYLKIIKHNASEIKLFKCCELG